MARVFTTLITWSYYGERALTFLYGRLGGRSAAGERRMLLSWRLLWCVAIFVGSYQDLTLVWRLGDIANAAMALPNLIALAALSGVVFAIARGNLRASRRSAAAEPAAAE
ncbi:MAG: alanine:cation symporter family protein [Sphingomonadaceae bacterium]